MSIFRRQSISVLLDASPISFINADAGAISSGIIPSGDALNDIMLMHAQRGADNTAITVPLANGWTVPTGANITDHYESAGQAVAVGYKFVDNVGGETSGTWTNAQNLECGLYRGVDQTSPILAQAFLAGTGDTVDWPAVTYIDPFAWVVLSVRTTGNVTHFYPAGFSIRASANRGSMADSNGVKSSFAGGSATITGALQWMTAVTVLRS